MKSAEKNEEIRWQVLKTMLDEFPSLKAKTRDYLGQVETKNTCEAIPQKDTLTILAPVHKKNRENSV
jgi:hypothetical protein